MPPIRDPNRLFYDLAKPRMLTDEELDELVVPELQSVNDQLDQMNIRKLRQIDEAFSECLRTINDRILPLVEQHGENSAKIYESIKWVKPLMEAAASTRLDPIQGDVSATSEDAPGDLSHADSAASPNRTVSDDDDANATRVTEASTEGTPRALRHGDERDEIRSPSEPQWSNDMSPFQNVQADLQHGGGGGDGTEATSSGVGADYSTLRKNLPDAQRIRLRDLPPDSPDTPQFETMTFKAYQNSSNNNNKPSGSSVAQSRPGQGGDLNSILLPSEPSFAATVLDTPGAGRPSARTVASATHSAHLDQLSRRQIHEPSLAKASPMKTGAAPSSSKAAAGQPSRLKFPADIPQNWNGIADLSITGLTAFPSPMKAPLSAAIPGRSGAGPSSGRHLMSSPGAALLNASTSTLRRYPASPAPSIALSRTPAKEAARRIAESVYDATGEFDSPDMPSAIKNANTTRLFDFHAAARGEEQPGLDSPSQNRSLAHGGSGGARAGPPGSALHGNDSYASQPSFVQRSPTQLFHQQVSPPVSSTSAVAGAYDYDPRADGLANFGGVTTANIDDLLAGSSSSTRYDPAPGSSGAVGDFAGIVDDDYERPLAQGNDDSFTGDAEPDYGAHRPTDPTFTEYDEAYAQATGRGALRLPGQDGPEDTLFGMPAGRGGGSRAVPANAGPPAEGKRVTYAAVEEDDTFTDDQAHADGGRSGFRLHGLDDMATLHGGELLSSEPFQASPLAQKSHGQP
ncbi:hypothetical protein JCM10908_005300 [Rhodotorula pacifica]|uniref:uncharacterized protein n=1 Tax=Rhodotorula pacifica TaxID=1495444 RepID=UPI00317942FD